MSSVCRTQSGRSRSAAFAAALKARCCFGVIRSSRRAVRSCFFATCLLPIGETAADHRTVRDCVGVVAGIGTEAFVEVGVKVLLKDGADLIKLGDDSVVSGAVASVDCFAKRYDELCEPGSRTLTGREASEREAGLQRSELGIARLAVKPSRPSSARWCKCFGESSHDRLPSVVQCTTFWRVCQAKSGGNRG